MKLTAEQRKQLNRVKAVTHCKHNFKCLGRDAGVEFIAKTQLPGRNKVIIFDIDCPDQCSYGSPFEDLYICTCPVRIFVGKNIKKACCAATDHKI